VNNWKVIFAAVVIFGTGVITGGLLVNYVQHSPSKAARPKPAVTAVVRPAATNQTPRVADNAKPKPPEILRKQFLQQLDELLYLKADQHEAIQKIINEGQNLMRKVVQDARLEIREVLTPEQLKQFDELMKRPFRKPVVNTNAPVTILSEANTPATNARLVED
jgi:Spy/CpxP family protein refolding chaperone